MSKMIASILYCHERNVCHRDVKLDNFVYESNGVDAELKLIDFGLSHVLLHTQEKMHDRVGIPRPVESTGHATCATLACATLACRRLFLSASLLRRLFYHGNTCT